jgi:hypothetical protein
MIDALIWGGVMVPIVMLAAGIRRIPWRYAAMTGLGVGLVFAAGRLAISGVDPDLRKWLDPGTLVLLGALGGGITSLSFERGERERRRRSAAILDQPASREGVSDPNAVR